MKIIGRIYLQYRMVRTKALISKVNNVCENHRAAFILPDFELIQASHRGHCYRECKKPKNKQTKKTDLTLLSLKITVIFKGILRSHKVLKIIATHNSVRFSKLSIVTHAFKTHLLSAYCAPGGLRAGQTLCHKILTEF